MIVEQLRTQRHRDTTQQNYYIIWKIFNKFFLRLDRKLPTWDERLTLFVAYLIDNNKQSSTVKSYISAIKAILKTNGFKIDEDEFLLTSLTKACRIKNDVVRTKLPVNKGMLSLLIQRVQSMYKKANQPYLALLFSTLLVTTYYGLFRVDELTWMHSGHAALAKDVQVGSNKNKFLFILHSSKTHGKGTKPQLIKIKNDNMKSKCVKMASKLQLPCPYELLRHYARMRPPYVMDKDQFFVLSDGSPVTATMYRNCFSSALKVERFNHQLYSIHGIQAGRAGDLLKLGLSVETIKKLG